MNILFSAILGYLLGSLNGAQFIHHLPGRYRTIHPSRIGTHNLGVQNVWMMIGKIPALFVLAIDLPKGYLAILLGRELFNLEGTLILIPGMLAIVGHNWPIFFHFRGGRGVATLVGIILAYNWQLALIIFFIALPFVIIRFSGLTPFVMLWALFFFEYPKLGLPFFGVTTLITIIIFLRRIQGEWNVLRKSKRKLWVLKNILIYDRSSAKPPSLKELFY